MPTNEQRRATAKRKLERQLERRAAQARRRRLYTIIGSVVGVIARGRRRGGHRGDHQHVTRTARPQRPPVPRRAARRRRRNRRRWATASCRRSSRLPISAPTASTRPREAGQQAEHAAADREGAHRPGPDQRQHDHQPGQHRPAARQRQVALHRQQLRQPGPAGLLQRHSLPPADHQRGTCRCCSAATRPVRAPVARATSSPTSTRPTSTSPTTRHYRIRCCTRAEHWRWPTPAPAPTAASSSWCTRTRGCRRTTRCSARSTTPAWRPWTRSPPAAWPAAARTASRKIDVQVKSIGLD